jgi:transposase
VNQKSSTVYAGVDVAKATLQLHFQGRQCCLDNTPQGCAQLLQRVQAVGQVQLICEATGGYEKDLLTACHAAGQPVSRLNPAQVRHFARAQGQRAKNDPLDAAVLTAYGTALQPKPTPPADPATTALRELVQWRDHLQEQLTRARQTLEHGVPAFVARKQKQLVAHLEQQLKAVAREQTAALKRSPQLQGQVQALSQLDGVSTLTALSLLSRMPELGTLDRQAAAALAGLAPWIRQSGPWEGQRHIGGGRALVRRALYMPAVVLARMKHTPLGKFYARLRAAGKPAKVALTAVMRKLLLQMNRVLKELLTKNQTPQTV